MRVARLTPNILIHLSSQKRYLCRRVTVTKQRPAIKALCSGLVRAAKVRQFSLLFLAAASCLVQTGALTVAAQESVPWIFKGAPSDGAEPNGALVADADGNLYGTTTNGGANYNSGTVFELSPVAGGGWTEKVLWNFSASVTDGYYPSGSLIFDADGNLYGTTRDGGDAAYCVCGTVYELSPGTGGVWTEKILANFGATSTDGDYPASGLVFDASGNLYGTTAQGGTGPSSLTGTVFELSPGTGGAWTRKQLWKFAGGTTDGASPGGSLILDAAGNLYGATAYGGLASNDSASGAGTVFELSPGSNEVWTEKILYKFGATATDGINPSANLIFDSSGNLYGETQKGGTVNSGKPNGGTVFELSPSTGTEWTERLLWSFAGQPTDGSNPGGGLIFDSKGNIYGTTATGGSSLDEGSVFELSPANGDSWSETILHPFAGYASSDGTGPLAALVANIDGNLYGTTQSGGNGSSGTVFKISLAPRAATPTFSPAGGSYSSAQSVKISDATAGATIYYTTNGSAPTTSSTKYTAAISVGATETLEAIAVANGYAQSLTASAKYTIATAAALTSPTPGSTLTATSVTFSWTPASGATTYAFNLGSTGAGSSNLYNSGHITATSATATGLPANSEAIYAELWAYVNNAWVTKNYTYTATGKTAAALTSPTPGSTLTGSTVTFSWTAATGATTYALNLGSTGAGSSNLYNSGHITTTSATATGLPLNSETVYAELWAYVNGAWVTTDYTYKAAGKTAAALTTPTPGSTLAGSTVTFSWTAATGATTYALNLGSTGAGSSNLYNSGHITTTSATATGLPLNGETVYAELWAYVNGAWVTTNYTYKAAGKTTAALTTPTPGSTLAGSTVTFSWTAATGAITYALNLGSTGAGSSNLYNSGHITTTSATATGLPLNGEAIYAELWAYVNGAWVTTNYTYTAASGAAPAIPARAAIAR
jgi:uncharacterized repeat protein (TIGR03803 family)